MRCSLTLSLKVVAFGLAIVWITAVPLAAQTGTAGKAAAGAKAWTAPKTAWGHPDLQGIWTNTTTTPLERLPEAADKQVLTEEERTELARKVAERVNADTRKPGQVGVLVRARNPQHANVAHRRPAGRQGACLYSRGTETLGSHRRGA